MKCTVPRYAVAVLPEPSCAVTVTEAVVPAVTLPGDRDTASADAGAGYGRGR